MINFISSVLGAVIRVIYNIVGQNYLIALLIFTFLTKLILFPLMLKQLKSTKSIQAIAPEDKKLREKYKNDPQKLSEELNKLYVENKVSPWAGCLVPIIQIPIILAMFYVVRQPLTYVLHMDQEQITSYTAQYLNVEESQVDEKMAKAYEINVAKEYQEEIGLDLNLGFGMSLGDVPKDSIPYLQKDETKRVSYLTLIIPILSLIFSVISTKVSQKNMQMSEDQAEMQKSMNLMMPILSAWIAVCWPLALGVYWLFGNILSIGQQFIMDKLMEDKSEPKDGDKKLFLGKGENND